jgi:uncharacterized membrane protein (TIGR02234 family)
MRSGKRRKLALILLVLAASAVALLAWSRVWINAGVVTGAAGSGTLTLQVSGAEASPALTALALAGVALAGALTIAGPVIRLVLGVLEVVLGGCVVLAAALAVSDPASASASVVTAATGIAGEESILDAITSTSLTAWPYVAIGAGVVMAFAGIAILVTGSSWPRSTSRYQAVRLEPALGGTDEFPTPAVSVAGAASAGVTSAPAGAAQPGEMVSPADGNSHAVDSWDDLSRGSDPTR